MIRTRVYVNSEQALLLVKVGPKKWTSENCQRSIFICQRDSHPER